MVFRRPMCDGDGAGQKGGPIERSRKARHEIFDPTTGDGLMEESKEKDRKRWDTVKSPNKMEQTWAGT